MPHYPQPTQTGRLGAAAQRMAHRGWHVFPVHPRSKIPAISDWENAATADPDQITAWWQRRAWNIGISTGPSGLLVIDLDPSPSRGAPAPDRWPDARHGCDVLKRLAAAAGEPAPVDTFTVGTPSGGRHLYFQQPDGLRLRNTQGALGWRIDTRGHGGYVLAPGSRGPAGRYYRTLRDDPVAVLPNWLLSTLTPPEPTDPPPRNRVDDDQPVAPTPRMQAYLRAVVEGERHAVATAEVGHRHTTLLRAACRLGNWVAGGALDESHARTALTEAAARHLGIAGYTARQIDRDITDGLTYGARCPRYLDDLPHRRPQH